MWQPRGEGARVHLNLQRGSCRFTTDDPRDSTLVGRPLGSDAVGGDGHVRA